jgi:hypothetical protein
MRTWDARAKPKLFCPHYRIDVCNELLNDHACHHQRYSDMQAISNMEDNSKEFRLGVLLVHGVGTQPSGDTLVRWGDVLLKTLGSATGNRVQVQVGQSGRNNDPAQDIPTTAIVRLRSSSGPEKPWLLADGWWADVFLPPTYRQLVSWSVRALPWAIALHIAQRFWNTPRNNKGAVNLIPVAIAIPQLLVGLLLAPLFVFFLALTLPLGLLPIPNIRSLILAAQGALVSAVGDSLAFVESPVRAALIRTRILNRLEWLKKRCERTIIVAHSQGAAVVLDALGAIIEPVPQRPLPVSDAPSSAPAPDTLVTFGAGTNQLTSLKRLSAGLPSGMGDNPVIYAMSALLALGGIIAWLCVAAFLYRPTATKILLTAGILVVFYAVFGLLMWTVRKLIERLGKRWNAVKKHEARITHLTLTVLLIPVIGPFFFAEKSGLPLFLLQLGLMNFILMALIGLIAGITMILSKEMKTAVTMVIVPPKLHRWHDLYASADPVPNGPTRTVQPEFNGPEFKSIRISNLGSFFADHTAYWDNLDGFVLPVLRACAETAESAWKGELPLDSPEVSKRAAWRVGWLRLARWTVYLSWLVVGAGLWSLHGNAIPLPFELPGWLPSIAVIAARFAMLTAAIAVAAWASFGLVRFIWRRWVRAEQQMVFGHQAIDAKGFWPLVGMGFVVWYIIGLASLAVSNQLSGLASINVLGDIAPMIFGIAPMNFGLAVVSALALIWLLPGPRVPQPKVSLASTVAGDSSVVH